MHTTKNASYESIEPRPPSPRWPCVWGSILLGCLVLRRLWTVERPLSKDESTISPAAYRAV